MGFANYEKLQIRREPLYPSDLAFLGQAGFLREMVDPSGLVTAGLLALLVVLTSVLLDRSPVYPDAGTADRGRP